MATHSRSLNNDRREDPVGWFRLSGTAEPAATAIFLPRDTASLGAFLRSLAGRADEQRVLEAMKNWRVAIEELRLIGMPDEHCAALSRTCLDWLEGRRAQRLEAVINAVRGGLAGVSNRPEEVWPYVHELMRREPAPGASPQADLGIEREVVRVALAAQDARRPALLTERDFENVISWLRARMALGEVMQLIKARRHACSEWTHERRAVQAELRRADKSGDSPQTRVLQRRLAMLDARVSGTVVQATSLRSPGWQAARAAGVSLTQIALPQLLMISAVVGIVTWSSAVRLNLATLASFWKDGSFDLSQFLPQLVFTFVYGLIALVLIYKSLTTPLLPEPVRTLLLISSFSWIVPLLGSDTWRTLVQAPPEKLVPILFLLSLALIVVSFRCTYHAARDVAGRTPEALQRAITCVVLLLGQALMYAVFFIDLLARQLLYAGDGAVTADSLVDARLWGVVPELIIVPAWGAFGIHLLPVPVLLWTLASVILPIAQPGMYPLASALRVKQPGP